MQNLIFSYFCRAIWLCYWIMKAQFYLNLCHVGWLFWNFAKEALLRPIEVLYQRHWGGCWERCGLQLPSLPLIMWQRCCPWVLLCKQAPFLSSVVLPSKYARILLCPAPSKIHRPSLETAAVKQLIQLIHPNPIDWFAGDACNHH